ncbi:MAG: hypothetical protein WCK00_15870, partial [Deltaproteobacteria bacterium]
ELKPDGSKKKLWIPAGLIIPTFRGETLLRVRVRRHEPVEGSRYIFLPGGSSDAMVFCGDKKTIVVVESELDAILLHQDAGDVCGAVALGSATIRPDSFTHDILSSVENILVALDSDDAGAKEAWTWWKENYPNSDRLPVIDGKDPTEAKKNGLPLREWILAGIPDTPSSAKEIPEILSQENVIVSPKVENPPDVSQIVQRAVALSRVLPATHPGLVTLGAAMDRANSLDESDTRGEFLEAMQEVEDLVSRLEKTFPGEQVG